MMKDKYYAVYGSNGFGVFVDYTKAAAQMKFMTKGNLKRLNDKKDAFEYAIEMYNSKQSAYDFQSRYYGDEKLSLNWIYYRNNIKDGRLCMNK